ncbi:hypothetical protein BDV96DRAFT_592041 [Lophiotrema nucula]|uniref:Uncharacterized protein n=1 Tax=Lophiotrema nucula TaxID=690887 RepID=A0A6A5YGE8_9PLEO|nr:hypothetical protein BDV96DRAFT_592041 [Lophiotrema nucula]
MAEDPPIQAPTEAALYLHKSLTALGTLRTTKLDSTQDSPQNLEDKTAGIQDLQKTFLTHFTHLLLTDSPHYTHLSQLLPLLEPPFENPHLDQWQLWTERLRPVVEAIIAYTSSLRTREWERDPYRHPSVLPDMFPLRLWLLPYPGIPSSNPAGAEEREKKCKNFADQITVLTNRLAGTLYHSKLSQIKDALKRVKEPEDRARIACYLGDVRKTTLSWLSMQDLLRVEVAAHLLEGVEIEGLKKELRERVNELVRSWRGAGDEGVRKLGWGVGI